ncbi:MAG: extracellular solute-binding protein [Chloroflexi bacterium]|nr:extracellular solute-binding protein [Chloroflexota bacterium]
MGAPVIRRRALLQSIASVGAVSVIGALAACAPAPTPTPPPPTKAPAPAAPAPTQAPAAAPKPAAPTAAPTAAPKPAAPTAAPTAAPKPTVAAQAPAKAPGEAIVWAPVGTDHYMKAAGKEFMARNPNIKLTFDAPGGIINKYATALTAGVDLPDVSFLFDTHVPIYYQGLWDLTTLIKPYAKDMIAFKLQIVTVQGKTYSVPWDTGPCVMYYRRDICAKAGVDPEKILTYDDLLAAGQKVKEATGGKSRLLNLEQSPVTATNWVEMFASQDGVSLFNRENKYQIKTPEFTRALNYLETVRKSDLGIRRTWNTPAYFKAFLDGEVVFHPYASWWANFVPPNLKELNGQFGAVKLPAFVKGGGTSANMGGSTWAIAQKAKNRENGWAYLEFAMLTKEGWLAQLRAEGSAGVLPSYIPAYDDPFFERPVEFFGGQKLWKLWMEVAKSLPSTVWFPPFWSEANGIIGNHFQAMFDGKKTVEQVQNDSAAELKQKIKEAVI